MSKRDTAAQLGCALALAGVVAGVFGAVFGAKKVKQIHDSKSRHRADRAVERRAKAARRTAQRTAAFLEGRDILDPLERRAKQEASWAQRRTDIMSEIQRNREQAAAADGELALRYSALADGLAPKLNEISTMLDRSWRLRACQVLDAQLVIGARHRPGDPPSPANQHTDKALMQLAGAYEESSRAFRDYVRSLEVLRDSLAERTPAAPPGHEISPESRQAVEDHRAAVSARFDGIIQSIVGQGDKLAFYASAFRARALVGGAPDAGADDALALTVHDKIVSELEKLDDLADWDAHLSAESEVGGLGLSEPLDLGSLQEDIERAEAAREVEAASKGKRSKKGVAVRSTGREG